MGVLGEMFPGAKIQDEASEDGDAQPWRLGPIDLDNNVVQVHRADAPAPEAPTGAASAAVQSAVPDSGTDGSPGFQAQQG